MAAMLEGLKSQFIAAFITGDRWKLYFAGLGKTVSIAACAALLGILIGTVIALMKLTRDRRGRRTVLTILADLYIDIIRGTPSVIQLMIMSFVIMRTADPFLVAVLSFGINSGAYVAEIVRAGILAVDKGQTEAGRSLGLSYRQTLQYIVLPQAFKNALPPLLNEFITLLKETAIVGYVGFTDLTRAANQISSKTYQPLMPLVGAAAIYFVVIKVMTTLFAQWERRLRRSDNR